MENGGATLILGHHSHTIQGGLERYKGGLIAYSLGNFQFDTEIFKEGINSTMILSVDFDRHASGITRPFPASSTATSSPRWRGGADQETGGTLDSEVLREGAQRGGRHPNVVVRADRRGLPGVQPGELPLPHPAARACAPPA
ncbi:CapA family protein [Methanoculleus chikugoensis]|uniref:CapA family protein n=1 Tax=Methanoculleus chikugoensis TaxID=118126 RepID=UPI001FB55BE8|nr:CapA family protein [Methanoculleus chikugoensis]